MFLQRLRLSALAGLAGSVLLASCGGGGQDEATSEADEEESPPVPVETGYPVRGDIFAIYAGTAPIEAYAEADVVAKVAGEVRDILVEEGDEVAEGQVLARLDGDMLRLELEESDARLQKLRRDYERNVDLKKKGLISSGDFDEIRYEMDALEASYNLAKLELEYTRIKAPIDGVVSERFVKVGNTIAVGDLVFTVTSLDPLVAYLFVPERQYGKIQAGQPVGIEIDALGDRPVIAEVTRVSPVVDPATGTFKVTVEISDPERRIKPGMFGRIGIIYDQHENVLQVPRSAILEDDGETSVFVVADGVATRRPVKTGYTNKGMIEIVDGIADDEAVITTGQVGLKDNAKVTVIGAEEPVSADSDDAEDTTAAAGADESSQETEDATAD